MMQRRKVVREDRIPYLIWSYNYSHASAGPKALHRLCHELNEAGETAYVSHPWTNAAWNTPFRRDLPEGDWIAVYPEIVRGNPWNAPRVVRWVLNTPGKLGGDATYDPSEMVFTWSPVFTDAPLLYLPTYDLDLYQDRGVPRSGAMVYVGKGVKDRDIAGTEITREMREDPQRLADELNRAEVLYSFDDATGMAEIALLCGCPVEMIPTGRRWEPDRARLLADVAAIPEQVREFIAVTQGALVPA